MKAILFASSANSDIPVNMAMINNLSATSAPTVNDDANDKYEVGSSWVNTVGKIVYVCVDATVGAAVWVVTSSDETTPGQVKAPNAATPTGNGSAASVTGGSGGSTSGNGGSASLDGGAATAGNGNGGDANLIPGAKNGTGAAGISRISGTQIISQGAPTAVTVSGTLTAAALLSRIITVNQGAAGASAQQLPLAADLDAALPTVVAGEAFDFSVINTSTVDAEDASITTNTGWTLVGEMDLQAHSALAAQGSSGRFRARKTGAGAWTLYRLS
jgi:hypothetical protein